MKTLKESYQRYTVGIFQVRVWAAEADDWSSPTNLLTMQAHHKELQQAISQLDASFYQMQDFIQGTPMSTVAEKLLAVEGVNAVQVCGTDEFAGGVVYYKDWP